MVACSWPSAKAFWLPITCCPTGERHLCIAWNPVPVHLSCGQLWEFADVQEVGYQSGTFHPGYPALGALQANCIPVFLGGPCSTMLERSELLRASQQGVDLYTCAGTNQSM